jgi:Mg-chelatase subunit ChlD
MRAWLFAASLVQAPAPAAPPIDLIMLVDVSRSVAFGVVRRDHTLMSEVGSALATAMASGDAVRLGTFGDTMALDRTPLRDAAAVRSRADALAERVGGASPIWDALVNAASSFPGSSTRRGIVVVTDGRSNGNRLGFAEALERLKASHVPVFVVSIDKSDRALPDPGARLIALAEATGGTCLFVERPALKGAILRAVRTLRDGSE